MLDYMESMGGSRGKPNRLISEPSGKAEIPISMKYALWLMPKGEPYERFSALINELSLSHRTPPLGSHITLMGGLMPPVEDVIEKSRELAFGVVQG